MKLFNDFNLCKRKGCVEEKVTKSYCRYHQNLINYKNKTNRLKRRQKGICKTCNVTRMKNSSYCLYHYFKRIALKTAHNPNLGPLLFKRYLEQGKRCYYTREAITLGIDASLDHVHCQDNYKHWKSDIRNLVWTSKNVNKCKSNLELSEFLNICEKVALRSKEIRREYVKT